MGFIHTNHFSSKFWPFEAEVHQWGWRRWLGLTQLSKPPADRHWCMMGKVKGRRGPQAHRDQGVRAGSSTPLPHGSLREESADLLPPAGRQHELHNRGSHWTVRLTLQTEKLLFHKWLDATSKNTLSWAVVLKSPFHIWDLIPDFVERSRRWTDLCTELGFAFY